MARVAARISQVQARFGYAPRPAAVVPASTRASTPSLTESSGATFRDVLDATARTASLGVAGSSSANVGLRAPRAPGTFGPITLPVELRGTQNGRLPESVLEPIGQGNHRLTRTAALAFRRMAAAAARDGVTLTVSDSYRSLLDQARTADDVGLYKEGGFAAVPGTSTHGWGLSVDIDVDPRTTQWLRAHAAEFGFAEDVAREPWHYTYRPADL